MALTEKLRQAVNQVNSKANAISGTAAKPVKKLCELCPVGTCEYFTAIGQCKLKVFYPKQSGQASVLKGRIIYN